MNRETSIHVSLCLLAVTTVFAAGCHDTSLPQSLKVALPDETSVEAAIHSGPPQLANSTWALYEADKADDAREVRGLPLIRIEFGPKGEAVRGFDNTEFGSEYIGDTLVLDGTVHPALFPGASYVAQSYGAGDGPNLGFTAMGKFFIGPAEAVIASLTATGTLNEAADRFEGTVNYHLDVNPEFAKVLSDLLGKEDEHRRVIGIKEK